MQWSGYYLSFLSILLLLVPLHQNSAVEFSTSICWYFLALYIFWKGKILNQFSHNKTFKPTSDKPVLVFTGRFTGGLNPALCATKFQDPGPNKHGNIYNHAKRVGTYGVFYNSWVFSRQPYRTEEQPYTSNPKRKSNVRFHCTSLAHNKVFQADCGKLGGFIWSFLGASA